MPKLTFDEALQRINDEMPVHRNDVQARALRRHVWIAEWHLPGCLSESFSVCLTKSDAIDCALSMAEGADGAPRGMRADLQRSGWSDRVAPDAWARGAITTIERRTLADILGGDAMEFQARRPDGSLEWRRHVPFHILPDGQRFKAMHAGNGRLLGRFDTVEIAERSMRCMTEPIPHYKAK